MLAAGLIRDNLKAHLALARVGEQPPSSTPTSLPVWTISGTTTAYQARASGEFWKSSIPSVWSLHAQVPEFVDEQERCC